MDGFSEWTQSADEVASEAENNEESHPTSRPVRGRPPGHLLAVILHQEV